MEEHACRGLQQTTRPHIELLETWLILEYCDHGSFDNSIRAGNYMCDLVRTASRLKQFHWSKTRVSRIVLFLQ